MRQPMECILGSAGVRGVSPACRDVTGCFGVPMARRPEKTKGTRMRVPFAPERDRSVGMLGAAVLMTAVLVAAALAVEYLAFHRLAAAFRTVMMRTAALV